jgi:hypothetical protein
MRARARLEPGAASWPRPDGAEFRRVVELRPIHVRCRPNRIIVAMSLPPARRPEGFLTANVSVIRRRHVFYVEGYDPRGAQGYYDLFRRSWKRCLGVWHFEGELGELELDSELIAHWDIEASGPNWRAATRYEFLRLEAVIGANMAEPMWRQVPRALAWTADDLITGTTVRIFRAAWRFGLHLLCFQMLLLLWLALALAGGWLAGLAAARLGGLPGPAAIAIGGGVGIACFLLLRPLADRLQVVQINSCWPYLREFARGAASAFDAPLDGYAARIVAAARGNQCDEIVVVGHSAAGVTACAVMARAFALDPQVGRRGPQIVLLTLGSVMPAAALHPAARRMRDVVRVIATEPSLTWVDCVSRKDVMNFWDFDPVAGTGVEVGGERCNPLVWQVRFKDVVSAEYYRRLRTSFFRLHYQFIMSGDRRAPYDYLMLVAGPVPVAKWARHPDRMAAAFGPDGAYDGHARAGAVVAGAGAQD